MSENEYQQLIERLLTHDATSPMISSETGGGGRPESRQAGGTGRDSVSRRWRIGEVLLDSPRRTFESSKSRWPSSLMEDGEVNIHDS